MQPSGLSMLEILHPIPNTATGAYTSADGAVILLEMA
jgi:hypothetical protein